MPHPALSTESIPELNMGMNLLETSTYRTTALHQLALGHLGTDTPPVVWIDARENAATYLLDSEFRPTPTVRIARAFTAYQHYELIRCLPGQISADFELLVLPCVASLYSDNDVPEWVGEYYVESVLAILTEVGELVDVPILVSCLDDNPFIDDVHDAAARTITCERTGLGFRYETEGFETTVYWGDGWCQTTIPYWVDLFGAVEESDPATAAADLGLLPGRV